MVATIDGRPLDDPALADAIDDAPASPPLPVAVRFELGPQFHLGQVVIDGVVPPDARAKLGLASGQPALAADVLAAQQRLLTAIREDGYPLAKVEMPPATLRPAENALDVEFEATTGPPAVFGDIAISGLKDMNEFRPPPPADPPGRPLQFQAIEKARTDLTSIGVFGRPGGPRRGAGPAGTAADHLRPDRTPAARRRLGVGYSTDLGANLNVGWHDRNLFGNAEQLNLTASYQAGGDAIVHPGYQVGAQFLKPDFLARDQQLELDLTAVKQDLQAYNQDALLEKIALNRKLSPDWTASVGLSGEQESVPQESAPRHYNLAARRSA